MTYMPDAQRQAMGSDARGFTPPRPRVLRNAWFRLLDIAVRILTLNSGRVITNNRRDPLCWPN